MENFSRTSLHITSLRFVTFSTCFLLYISLTNALWKLDLKFYHKEVFVFLSDCWPFKLSEPLILQHGHLLNSMSTSWPLLTFIFKHSIQQRICLLARRLVKLIVRSTTMRARISRHFIYAKISVNRVSPSRIATLNCCAVFACGWIKLIVEEKNEEEFVGRGIFAVSLRSRIYMNFLLIHFE